MSTVSRVVLPLRVLLVLVFLGLLVVQIMSFPGDFLDSPDDPLRWPILIFWELEALCVQIVIVCVWHLLTLIRRDRIFTAASLRWVDVIVWTVAAAWLLLAAMAGTLMAYMLAVPELRDPGPGVVLVGVTMISAVFVLIVVVMRELLRRATALQTDLEGVI